MSDDFDAARKRLEELHTEIEGDDSDGSFAPPSCCGSCGSRWPCDVRLLLDEVERLRQESRDERWRTDQDACEAVERLRTVLERISELTHTDDCKCQAAPIEECGCQPSMREIARAALRGEGE